MYCKVYRDLTGGVTGGTVDTKVIERARERERERARARARARDSYSQPDTMTLKIKGERQ